MVSSRGARSGATTLVGCGSKVSTEAFQPLARAVSATRLKQELAQLIQSQPSAKLDYIQFFDPLSLEPMEELRPGCHMALAVTIGKTRLIDNALI